MNSYLLIVASELLPMKQSKGNYLIQIYVHDITYCTYTIAHSDIVQMKQKIEKTCIKGVFCNEILVQLTSYESF